jgi:two-component system CheB/CheR fusion protein
MKRTVLVVDDDPGMTEALALVLELEGFAVETAPDAPRALERAARLRPDFVLCDLALGPGGDGCDVARGVRAVADLAKTRLFALSGTDSEEARVRSREAGFDLYLLKPVDTATLFRHLAGAPEA